MIILLMEEILHHLRCKNNLVNNGIFTNLNSLAGYLNHQPDFSMLFCLFFIFVWTKSNEGLDQWALFFQKY